MRTMITLRGAERVTTEGEPLLEIVDPSGESIFVVKMMPGTEINFFRSGDYASKEKLFYVEDGVSEKSFSTGNGAPELDTNGL